MLLFLHSVWLYGLHCREMYSPFLQELQAVQTLSVRLTMVFYSDLAPTQREQAAKGDCLAVKVLELRMATEKQRSLCFRDQFGSTCNRVSFQFLEPWIFFPLFWFLKV